MDCDKNNTTIYSGITFLPTKPDPREPTLANFFFLIFQDQNKEKSLLHDFIYLFFFLKGYMNSSMLTVKIYAEVYICIRFLDNELYMILSYSHVTLFFSMGGCWHYPYMILLSHCFHLAVGYLSDVFILSRFNSDLITSPFLLLHWNTIGNYLLHLHKVIASISSNHFVFIFFISSCIFLRNY